MSSSFLCEMLGPKWISTSGERDIMYTELERRGVQCGYGYVAGYTKDQKSTQESSNKATKTSGTGFIISSDGHIITNHHVVNECTNITVLSSNGRFNANLMATDSTNDIAIVQSENTQATEVATFRSGNSVRVGEDITVVGYPLGTLLGSTIKATSGTVSSLTGIQGDTSIMQINAPIQPGNSGGPLLDDSGNVVGMVASKLNEIAVAGLTGSLSQNVNFAIKNSPIFTFLWVQGIQFRATDNRRKISRPDIVEKANRYTVMVSCDLSEADDVNR